MSEIDIDFEEFHDFSQYDPHFDIALSNVINNSAIQESEINLSGNKLFVSLDSVHGIPKSNKLVNNMFRRKFSVYMDMESNNCKKMLDQTQNVGVFAVKDNQNRSVVFDLVQFYGMTKLNFTLKCKNSGTGAKSVLGTSSVMLSELIAQQNKHNSSDGGNGWAVHGSVDVETSLLQKCRSAESSPVDKASSARNGGWLRTAKSDPSSGAGGIMRMKWSSVAVAKVPVTVSVKFSFRLVALQHCLELRSRLTLLVPLPDLEAKSPHMGSELHALSATAQASEVVSVMCTLAAKHALGPALRLRSSLHCTPLDCALLAGNDSVAVEILQRAGVLCFRDLATGRAGPFHHAVRGGSRLCVETLWRFFRKYSPREASVAGGATHWCPTLSALLEWRDEQGDTPLMMACRLSDRGHLASLLLLCGADIAAVNSSGCSPLLLASAAGNSAVVGVLLSVLKSAAELEENLYAVSAAVVAASHDNALQRHLRLNARSRNLLKGRSPVTGGFLNPLSLLCCDPALREGDSGRQAVHLAAQGGHAVVISMLLGVGVSCAETDRHGDNLFHLLAKGGHLAAVSDPRILGFERSQWAAHLELLRDLLVETMHSRAKALTALNFRGKSPTDLALEGDHLELAAVLEEAARDIYGEPRPALSALREMLAEAGSRPHSVALVQTVLSVGDSGATAPARAWERVHQEEKEDCAPSPRRHASPGPKTSGSVSADRLKVLLATKETPSCVSDALQQQDDDFSTDDRADEEEYRFALSALALKNLGDSTASTMQ